MCHVLSCYGCSTVKLATVGSLRKVAHRCRLVWFAFVLLQGRSPGDPILPPHFHVHNGCSGDEASRLGKVLWASQGKREAGAGARNIVLTEGESLNDIFSGCRLSLFRRTGVMREVMRIGINNRE